MTAVAVAVASRCLHCPGSLIHRAGGYACESCRYEISDEAYDLSVWMEAAFDADPVAFFDWVRERRDEGRALQPVWQRRE